MSNKNKKPLATRNKAADTETKAKRQRILAQIGQLALANEQLNAQFQQNARALVNLKQQLFELEKKPK